MAGKSAAKEKELISWDDVKDQKEVYQAVRTPDGRQALVKAGGAQSSRLPSFTLLHTVYHKAPDH